MRTAQGLVILDLARHAIYTLHVKGLLNFAPGVIRTPKDVRVVHVDLTVQLEQLAFLVHHGANEAGRSSYPEV